MDRILHLTVTKEWFDKIVSGEKTEEYREIKDYWDKRFVDKHHFFKNFDEVHFTNGYGSSRPFVRVECGRIFISHRTFMGVHKLVFVIELKKIIETRNIKE